MSITTSDRNQRSGVERLSDACNYLLQSYTRGPSWINPAPEEAFGILFMLSKGIERERLVPVYRKHQPAQWSPCMLGSPCEVCLLHIECKGGNRCRQCVKGKRANCLRVEDATPAFMVTKTAAIKMVKAGFAEFGNSNRTVLRLTFSSVTELRGGSVQIDEGFLIAYAMGKAYAVEVIEGKNGWEDSATARTFTTKWPVIYGDAVCAWPQIAKASVHNQGKMIRHLESPWA